MHKSVKIAEDHPTEANFKSRRTPENKWRSSRWMCRGYDQQITIPRIETKYKILSTSISSIGIGIPKFPWFCYDSTTPTFRSLPLPDASPTPSFRSIQLEKFKVVSLSDTQINTISLKVQTPIWRPSVRRVLGPNFPITF